MITPRTKAMCIPNLMGNMPNWEKLRALADKYTEKFYIGEPFYITEIYKTVNRIDGVIDTIYVEPLVFSGGQYSALNVMVDSLKSPDGTYLKTPKNCILEIKNFSDVVKGTVVQ